MDGTSIVDRIVMDRIIIAIITTIIITTIITTIITIIITTIVDEVRTTGRTSLIDQGALLLVIFFFSYDFVITILATISNNDLF